MTVKNNEVSKEADSPLAYLFSDGVSQMVNDVPILEISDRPIAPAPRAGQEWTAGYPRNQAVL